MISLKTRVVGFHGLAELGAAEVNDCMLCMCCLYCMFHVFLYAKIASRINTYKHISTPYTFLIIPDAVQACNLPTQNHLVISSVYAKISNDFELIILLELDLNVLYQLLSHRWPCKAYPQIIACLFKLLTIHIIQSDVVLDI